MLQGELVRGVVDPYQYPVQGKESAIYKQGISCESCCAIAAPHFGASVVWKSQVHYLSGALRRGGWITGAMC